jgi:hypothetical protein
VDPEAFKGGGRLIRHMTDGRIGYNVPGAYCARPEGLNEVFPCEESGAMSASGMWGLALVERHGVEMPDLKIAIETCADLPPLWNGGRLDMYYWYYGTLAFHAQHGKEWKKWYPALQSVLIENQRKDASAFAGSWDPVGPWGHDGGRIYSTALCALALATPCRMSPDFARGKPVGVYTKAAKALAALAKHENKQIAARAELWSLRAGRK